MDFQLRDMLSGAVGALCLVAAGAPFDVVKTRIQTRPAAYTGVLQALRSVVVAEGAAALWKGASPAVVSACVENAVAFSMNGLLRRLVTRARGGEAPRPWDHVAIGALGGVVSATAICPPEVVKVRMQWQRGAVDAARRYRNSLHCAMEIVRHEGGVAGLFAGLPALLARDVPFNAVFFGSQPAFMSAITAAAVRLRGGDAAATAGGSQLGPIASTAAAFLAGGLAGAAAWLVVYPADSLKSKAQVAGALRAAGGNAADVVDAGIGAGARGRLAYVRLLYRGCSAAIARAFPANAALFGGQHAAAQLLEHFGV